MLVAQPLGDGFLGAANIKALHPQAGGNALGGCIQGVQVILAGIEKVAHLVVGHRQGLRIRAAIHQRNVSARVRGNGQFIADVAVTAVHINHRAGDGRVVIDQL